MSQLNADSQISRLKMIEEQQKFNSMRAKTLDELASSGQLRFQSTDANSPYNYPLINITGQR